MQLLNYIKKLDTIDWVVNITAITFLFTISTVPDIWVQLDEHKFPIVSVFEFLPLSYGYKFNAILFLGLILFTALIPLVEKKYALTGSLLFFTILLLQDINRIEPNIYQFYILFILANIYYWINRKNKFLFILCFQLVFIGIYFWAGFNKLTVHFESTYEWLMSIFEITKPLIKHKNLAYIMASFELILGLGLCFANYKLRRLFIFSIVIFHIQILVFLISANWISYAWPWNIMMTACVIVLFWSEDKSLKKIIHKSSLTKGLGLKYKFILLSVVFLFLIAPVGSIVRLWPGAFSYVIFSNTDLNLIFVFEENQVNCVSKENGAWTSFKKLNEKYNYMNLSIWDNKSRHKHLFESLSHLKRLVRDSNFLCNCPEQKNSYLQVEIKSRWNKNNTIKKYFCRDLIK